MHSTVAPVVKRILVLGKKDSVAHILISLSATFALEKSREFTAAAVEAMPPRFSILATCQTSTALLLFNKINPWRSCALWSFP